MSHQIRTIIHRTAVCVVLLLIMIPITLPMGAAAQPSESSLQPHITSDDFLSDRDASDLNTASIQTQSAVLRTDTRVSRVGWHHWPHRDNYASHSAQETDTDTQQTQQSASIAFLNGPVSNGSTTVTIDSARLGNQSVPNSEFVVVVHQTQTGGFDAGIGAKIGESDIISNRTQYDIDVDISQSVSKNDSVSRLTESQALVAMLYSVNPSESTNHQDPILRNGSPITDRAQISISTQQAQLTDTETTTTTTATSDGFGPLTALILIFSLTALVGLHFRHNV